MTLQILGYLWRTCGSSSSSLLLARIECLVQSSTFERDETWHRVKTSITRNWWTFFLFFRRQKLSVSGPEKQPRFIYTCGGPSIRGPFKSRRTGKASLSEMHGKMTGTQKRTTERWIRRGTNQLWILNLIQPLSPFSRNYKRRPVVSCSAGQFPCPATHSILLGEKR